MATQNASTRPHNQFTSHAARGRGVPRFGEGCEIATGGAAQDEDGVAQSSKLRGVDKEERERARTRSMFL